MKNKVDTNVTDALKDHYNDLTLSNEQFDELDTLMKQASSAESSVEKAQIKERDLESMGESVSFIAKLKSFLQFGALVNGGLIAACTVMIVALLLVVPFGGSQSNFTGNIISEIAYNHNKNMTMEITSPSIANVNRYLVKLGFSVISSSRFNNVDWELVGGRYCNIGGELAAQLKIRNKQDNQVYTLYQFQVPTGYVPEEESIERYSAGVKVTLWQEKGLLLGLASPLTI